MIELWKFLLKLFPINGFFPPITFNAFLNSLIGSVIVFGIIVSAGYLIYRFRKKSQKIKDNIEGHLKKLSAFDNRATEAFEDIKDLFLSNKLLKDKWIEYDHTLIKYDKPRKIFKTEPSEKYFNESTILSHEMNVRLWHALPAIFVGIGIFGTFVGLTLGLSQLKTDSTDHIKSGIDLLMSGMTTAFSTSVWGMLFSLIFNWYEKKTFNEITSVISRLNLQTDKLFTLTSTEKIQIEQQKQLEIQTIALQQFSTDLADKIKISMDNVMSPKFESLYGILEMLFKSEERSTQKIANEIKTSGENMTKSFQETVGKVIQETSLDAVRKLTEEFKTYLTGATKEELGKLAGLIQNAGQSFSSFPSQFDEIKASLKDMMSNLMIDSASATAMMREEAEKSANNFGAVIKELQNNVEQLLVKQESNAQVIENLINSSSSIVQQGTSVLQATTEVTKFIVDGITKIQNSASLLEKTADAYRDTAETLKIITKEFSEQSGKHIKANREAVENITSILENSKDLMTEYVEKFEIIKNGLSGIFQKLEEGLNQYTQATRQNLNDSLSEFTVKFKESAEHLSGSVDYLKETVEDLEDILTSITKKK